MASTIKPSRRKALTRHHRGERGPSRAGAKGASGGELWSSEASYMTSRPAKGARRKQKSQEANSAMRILGGKASDSLRVAYDGNALWASPAKRPKGT